MRIYEILDKEPNVSIGFLLYYEYYNSYVIELSSKLTEWEAPLLFLEYIKKGIFTIPREDSHLWVKERIIPPGRQNIGFILNTHRMEQYDEIKFLEISHGRCSQDSMYLRKTEILPDYILQRQKTNLVDITPLENNRLLCFFADKKVKVVSLIDCIKIKDVSKILNNKSLYKSVAISPGGYGATFNDSIDIPVASLYELGTSLPIDGDDIKQYITNNVLSTTEACEKLECSRQNLAYLSKSGKLEPLKKSDNSSLYIKGNLEKIKW